MREEQLRKSALKLLTAYGAQGATSQVTAAQLEVQANRAAKLTMGLRRPGMMLLDDPVGTGKTPVSLCVASLLFSQGEIDYALVVAPSERVAKIWRDRAQRIQLVITSDSAKSGTKRWRPGSLLVATQRRVPRRICQGQNPARTLVIVDEAHRGLSNEDTVAFQSLQPLAQGTRVLLVTATPLQISPSGFLNMLTVGLAGNKKEALKAPIQAYAKSVKDLLQRWREEQDTAAAEQAVNTHRPAFEEALLPFRLSPYPDYDQENIPTLNADKVPLTDNSAWLRAYHVAQLVPELLADGKGDMFQRRLVSCSEAFWNGSAGELLTAKQKDDPPVSALVQQLTRRLGTGSQHPKVKATCDWAVDKMTNKKDPRHVLIFCCFHETQQALQQELARLLGQQAVHAPDDQVLEQWRTRFCQAPSKTNPPLVLIARDNLSESIDLDGGKPCMVHHDLPWNPARIQQRYGRVVRISTGFQRIAACDVFIPVLDTEIDLRLYATLIHRCALIQRLLPSRHGLRPDSKHVPQAATLAVAPPLPA